VFCPECGKEIPAGSNFCLFCGSSLDRVRRFLEETELTKDKGNPHITEKIDDSKRAQAAVFVTKGDQYILSGNEEDALRCYTTAIGLDPSSYEAWNRKAELLVRMGRTMEARICNENITQLKGSAQAGSLPERNTSLPDGKVDTERYIGGLSSPSLKLSLSEVGGYGIYLTEKRVFILKNQKHVFGHPKGPAMGGFIYAELFGGTVDNNIKTIEELEIYKEIEIYKNDIVRIDFKKPLLLSGYVTFFTKNNEIYKIFIEYKKVFEPLRKLILKFYPDVVRAVE
jgi:tetratricopeptide (TPR) repeat protein